MMGRNRFHILRMHEQNTQNFARCLDDPACDDYKQILLVLNNHEFIACGVKRKALDEGIYKRMYYSAIVRDWDSFSGLVTQMRTMKSKPALFQDFEWLAHRFKKNP